MRPAPEAHLTGCSDAENPTLGELIKKNVFCNKYEKLLQCFESSVGRAAKTRCSSCRPFLEPAGSPTQRPSDARKVGRRGVDIFVVGDKTDISVWPGDPQSVHRSGGRCSYRQEICKARHQRRSDGGISKYRKARCVACADRPVIGSGSGPAFACRCSACYPRGEHGLGGTIREYTARSTRACRNKCLTVPAVDQRTQSKHRLNTIGAASPRAGVSRPTRRNPNEGRAQ